MFVQMTFDTNKYYPIISDNTHSFHFIQKYVSNKVDIPWSIYRGLTALKL